jgi:hypothetical protein
MLDEAQFQELMEEVRQGNADAHRARQDVARVLACLEGDQLDPAKPPGLVRQVETLKEKVERMQNAARDRESRRNALGWSALTAAAIAVVTSFVQWFRGGSPN